MLARRDSTEQTHDSTRAIHYNTVNIQKCAWLSERSAEQNQYAHATTRRATAKHHNNERARRANIQNHHATTAKTRREFDIHQNGAPRNCANTDKHKKQTLQRTM